MLVLMLAIAAAVQAEDSVPAAEDTAAPIPDGAALEAGGAVIGTISIERWNVFDLSDPRENNWLYRWANRLHIVTREKTIRKQLLVKQGDPYVQRLAEETGRILRRNRYLYEASVEPVRYENGVVDLKVETRDIWSLTPDLSLSRSGGENRTKIGIEETNLFGRGQNLEFAYIDNVDRESHRLEFADPHIGRSWVKLFMRVADNSDGRSNLFSTVRPFHKLDARWTAGGSILDDERRTALYRTGDEAGEFRHERDYMNVFGGWSKGLHKNWVRRWTAGVVYDDNQFSAPDDPSTPVVLPENRKLVYPYLGFEFLEDRFETASNHDQIGKTEDFYVGIRANALIGWSDESFDNARDALIYSASLNKGFGSLDKTALLLAVGASGRIEDGETKNAIAAVSARYYKRQSSKRLFFASVEATIGHDLDLDNPLQLGGNSGLRGYPLRYQNGDSKALITVEQRYFTDWYPFRLFRVGGAAFADVGRTWGNNPLGGESQGWLTDVGIGLRLAPTRSNAGKMVHLDLAFPLDGDDSIDDVQILLEAKSGF